MPYITTPSGMKIFRTEEELAQEEQTAAEERAVVAGEEENKRNYEKELANALPNQPGLADDALSNIGKLIVDAGTGALNAVQYAATIGALNTKMRAAKDQAEFKRLQTQMNNIKIQYLKANPKTLTGEDS